MGPTPRFSKPIEALLARAKDITGDEAMFQYAVRESSVAGGMAPTGARAAFNFARSAVDSIKGFHPDIQIGHLAAARYAAAQQERIQELLVGLEGMLRQAFGKEALTQGKIAGPGLAGRVPPSAAPYVGTVWHILDNPTLYRLSPLQRRAAEEWGKIFNAERDFSARMGVAIGQVEGNWIAHSFKQPQELTRLITRPTPGMGKPGPLKARKLTTEQFLEVATAHNLEVETDVLKIAARRLNSTARMRSTQVFLDELARKVGGRRLKPGKSPMPGERVVQAGGRQWVFPEEIANQVQDVLRPMQVPPDEAIVSAVVDVARATLLNLDFSVGGMRQGLLGMVADPRRALEAYHQAWMVLAQPEGLAIHLVQNAARYQRWSQRGLGINMSPLDITIGLKGTPKSLLDRVPGVGWMYNLQFNTIMRPLKLAVAEANLATLQAVRDGQGLAGVAQSFPLLGRSVRRLGAAQLVGKSDDELAKIAADAANNWVGGIEWARIMAGRPSTLRKLAILTEGWTRARIGNVVNAPKLSPEGILARRMLAQEMTILVGIATAVNLGVSGSMPREFFDVRSSRFGVIQAPWGNLRLIPHAVEWRTVARAIAGKPADASDIKARGTAVLDFMEGRVGQFPRVIQDLTTGRDFMGRPIDNQAINFARSFMPIIVQTVWEGLEANRTASELAFEAGFEFAGATTFPEFGVVTEGHRDAARRVFGENFYKLGKKQRDVISALAGEFAQAQALWRYYQGMDTRVAQDMDPKTAQIWLAYLAADERTRQDWRQRYGLLIARLERQVSLQRQELRRASVLKDALLVKWYGLKALPIHSQGEMEGALPTKTLEIRGEKLLVLSEPK